MHVTSDLSGVVLPLGTGIFVGVQVRDELARAGPEPHRVLLRMIPKEFAQFAPAIIVPPLPGNPAGQSRFENLSPGIYSVEASPQQGPHDYVASLRCGNVDLLRDDLVIAPGAAPPPIEVTLRDDSAQLNLTVKAKAKPAAVVLYSEEYPRRSFLLPFNPTASSVSVSNLPPGTYKLLAVTDAVDLEFRNPAAMEKYLNHAKPVTLQPGDNTSAFVETQEVAEQPQ